MKLLTGKGSDSLYYFSPLAILLLSVALTFFPSNAIANNVKSFSGDRDIFIKELGAFMKKSNNQLITETFNSFERYFNQGAFTEMEVNTIITVSNKMLAQRITPNPVFKDYLTSLLFIKEGNNKKHLFNEWHQILTEVLTNDFRTKTKQFKNYVDFSSTLFSDGALVTGQKGKAWMLRNGKFHLGNSDGKFFVLVESGQLVKIQKNQELVINATSGYFYPDSKIWKGKNGTLTWSASEKSNIDCTLKNYTILLKGNLVKIDTVYVEYKKLISNQIIAGSFETKISTNQSVINTYPRFTSYQRNLTVDQLDDRVQLTGGIKLKGSSILVYGGDHQLAQLIIQDANQRPSLKAAGPQFNLTSTTSIAASGAAIDLILQNDIITHPSASLL